MHGALKLYFVYMTVGAADLPAAEADAETFRPVRPNCRNSIGTSLLRRNCGSSRRKTLLHIPPRRNRVAVRHRDLGRAHDHAGRDVALQFDMAGEADRQRAVGRLCSAGTILPRVAAADRRSPAAHLAEVLGSVVAGPHKAGVP